MSQFQIMPFITSFTEYVKKDPKVLIGIIFVVVSVICIFMYNPSKKVEEKEEKQEKILVKDCTSYFYSLCFLVISFFVLIFMKKITINSPLFGILNNPNTSIVPVPIISPVDALSVPIPSLLPSSLPSSSLPSSLPIYSESMPFGDSISNEIPLN
jgi:RsiW-degrading membrane proteinase PrsW (M82 family)